MPTSSSKLRAITGGLVGIACVLTGLPVGAATTDPWPEAEVLAASSVDTSRDAVAVLDAGPDLEYLNLDYNRGDWVYTSCMPLTDSIDRLYTAFFGRIPDEEGFNYWVSEYGSGIRNLTQISDFFSTSDEFDALYGSVSNAAFVELVYINVLGRAPEETGRAYWTGRLDDGLSRGELMVQFSESEEYVTKTETRTPMAGFFGYYPVGTTFTCGTGSATAQMGSGGLLDIMVFNWSQTNSPVQLQIRNNNGVSSSAELWSESFYTDAIFGVQYGDMTTFQIEAGPQIDWAVITYSPGTLPDDRAGWIPVP